VVPAQIQVFDSGIGESEEDDTELLLEAGDMLLEGSISEWADFVIQIDHQKCSLV